jgi:hypothetical protein
LAGRPRAEYRLRDIVGKLARLLARSRAALARATDALCALAAAPKPRRRLRRYRRHRRGGQGRRKGLDAEQGQGQGPRKGQDKEQEDRPRQAGAAEHAPVEDASADSKAAERPAAAALVGTAASTAAVAADGARTDTDDNTVAVIAAAASDNSSSGEENAITRGTRTATSGKAAKWRIVRNRWADFVDESAEEAEKSDMTEGFNESKTVSLKKLSGALPSTSAESVNAMSAVQTLGKNAAAKKGNVTEEKKESKTER